MVTVKLACSLDILNWVRTLFLLSLCFLSCFILFLDNKRGWTRVREFKCVFRTPNCPCLLCSRRNTGWSKHLWRCFFEQLRIKATQDKRNFYPKILFATKMPKKNIKPIKRLMKLDGLLAKTLKNHKSRWHNDNVVF